MLTFALGMTSRAVSVPVLGDGQPEPGEAFFMNLTTPANASILDG